MRRWLTGLAVGALVLTAAAPGATAAPPGESGPREDVIFDAINAKGDIVSATYTASFTDIFLTKVKVRVTTRVGTDPVTTGAWHGTNTAIRAFLDVTTDHPGADFVATMWAFPLGHGEFAFTTDVQDLTGAEPVLVECAATATFTAPNVYRANVPASCFSPLEPTRVRARVAMVWDPPPTGGTQGIDKSPDVGWGSTLVAPPPPP